MIRATKGHQQRRYPMHVFIVLGVEYDMSTVLGVFDSLDKANAYADKIEVSDNAYISVDVIISKVE